MIQASDFDRPSDPLVIIVTGDEGVRERLRVILRGARIETRAIESTGALLSSALPDRPTCLIIDVKVLGQKASKGPLDLVAIGLDLPIILVIGRDDLPLSESLNAAALDVVTVLFSDRDAMDVIENAIAQDTKRRHLFRENRSLVATLSPQEAEILAEMVKGLLNRQIAEKLGISETTVKIHRGNIMRKMKAASIADLVRKMASIKTKR